MDRGDAGINGAPTYVIKSFLNPTVSYIIYSDQSRHATPSAAKKSSHKHPVSEAKLTPESHQIFS